MLKYNDTENEIRSVSKMKKILVVVLVIAAVAVGCFGLASCKDDQPSEVLVGYDIDMAKALGEELGIEIVFQRITWSLKESELKAKNIDCIWNGMTITDERAAAMEISTPYMVNKQVVLIRKADASTYTSIASIAAAKLCAESGSAGEDAIKGNNTTKDASFTGIGAQIDIFTELLSGTSDVGVLDSIMANYYLKINTNFADKLMIANVDIVEEEENYGIAVRKGEAALLDKINTGLAALQTNGKAAEIANRYGLADVTLDLSYTSQWDSITDKSSWDYIQGRGKLIVGYTLFAPIAFMQEA